MTLFLSFTHKHSHSLPLRARNFLLTQMRSNRRTNKHFSLKQTFEFITSHSPIAITLQTAQLFLIAFCCSEQDAPLSLNQYFPHTHVHVHTWTHTHAHTHMHTRSIHDQNPIIICRLLNSLAEITPHLASTLKCKVTLSLEV